MLRAVREAVAKGPKHRGKRPNPGLDDVCGIRSTVTIHIPVTGFRDIETLASVSERPGFWGNFGLRVWPGTAAGGGRGAMGKARVSGWAVTLALLTAACSSQLPASGPTSEAILDRANSPDASVNFNYVLIDVTDPVINALATRPTNRWKDLRRRRPAPCR